MKWDSIFPSLPRNWSLQRVKFSLLDGRDGCRIGPFGSALRLDDLTDSGILVLGQENVMSSDYSFGKRYISDRRFEQLAPYEAKAGDILVTMMGSAGRCGVVPTGSPKAIIDSHLLRLRLDPGHLEGRFFLWFLGQSKAAIAQTDMMSNGSIMAGLNSGTVKNMWVPIPPQATQEGIADFLDQKTAAIDAVIEKKERLIELLAEKRAALVQRAVTKGQDPDVPMKDSGVPTLGSVPRHWRVVRNKTVMQEVNRPSKDGEEELLTVSHITGVTRRAEKDVTMFMAEDLSGYKRVEAGDLVINTMWAWMGALGVTPIPGIVSPAYGTYRFDHSVLDPAFYDYFFRTRPYIVEMTRYSKGVWTSRLRLYPEQFLSLLTAIPPMPEQRQIVEYVESATGSFRAIQEKLQTQIDRLREYRQALITAAVTGQLDIPGAEA
ncbi:MAG: restriction endonuclease subunit S [Acidobacteriota bacterium]